MKKQLPLGSLIAICLMLVFTLPAQQNKSANLSKRTNASFLSNHSTAAKSGSQAIITTTTSTCMSINLPAPATWSLVNYGTGTGTFAANGFVNGPNTYADKEKAMYFDASATANTMLTQVYVGFGIAYSATPSKTVAIRIYDGTGGTVGTALGQGTLSMGTIMNDVTNGQYSLLIFGTPINLPASKKFFVSVDVTGLQWTAGVKDSLSIVSNTSPQTSPTPVWEKQSNNTWYNYSNALSWQLSISLLIHPFLTQAPIVATMSTSGNTICAGQTISYNSSGSTAGTYFWSFGSIPTPTATGATTTAAYPSAGTYTTYMQVTDACGSLGLTANTITVKPNPTVTAVPNATTVCSGQNVTLAGNGATTYTWTGGVSNNVPFAATSTNNYTVTGTAANGCTAIAISGVVVNPNPTVTANTATTSICAGNSVTLNGGGASTYTWSGGVSNGVAFVPSASGSYTVTGTSTANCTGSTAISITVNSNPTVSATVPTASVCSGSNVTLSGSGALTYTWTGGISDNVAFPAGSTSNFTVTGTDANGCSGTAVASLTINPSPTVSASASSSMICTGGTLSLTGSGATSYTWTNGVNNGIAFTPTASNVYTVTGANSSGCLGTSTINITVSNCTGINTIVTEDILFNIYPNPNNGEFTLYINNEGIYSLEIHDALGKLVFSEKNISGNYHVNPSLPSGIYLLSIRENNKLVSSQKMIRN